MTTINRKQNSKIKEVVTTWDNIQQYLRSGDQGHLVPVVIPKDHRGYGPIITLLLALYLFGTGLMSLLSGGGLIGGFFIFISLIVTALGGMLWWWSATLHIEQGTTGILSHFGRIAATLSPGRKRLWWPWEKVEFIVDTSTEIPYSAPVLACPTRENVPLKSIEFFLKFRIIDPVLFVRNLGASNFDVVLSSAVQDAIRRRSRMVQTEKAYDLRGSDVGDMQKYLNKQMQRYGVRIVGANIPDVQLPNQYQQNLATRERVAKELSAYEKEWELTRKQRIDGIRREIERSKKERDAKKIEVKEAINKAREDVAQMLQEKETAAEKIRLEIEAEGRAELNSAEHEARALHRLSQAYKDNWAILQYELALRRLQVAEKLVDEAPRPVLINTQGGGEHSALSTLLLAQLLPDIFTRNGSQTANHNTNNDQNRILPNITPPTVNVDNETLNDLLDLARNQITGRRRNNS